MKLSLASFAESLQRTWYTKSGISLLLRPLSWVYRTLIGLRRTLYRVGILHAQSLSVPVIVVGNISVGGTGKTPLVIWLTRYLRQAGFKPGVISRGYGGSARQWPQQVRPDADPVIVGDEALVISRQTQAPMAVGPDRAAAAMALQRFADVDVIISDDGLQHYGLQRDIEIVVVDGIRRFGNGFCLPAGPLREPKARLLKVDFIVTNGAAIGNEIAMTYHAHNAINLGTNQTRALEDFKSEQVIAIAGIGNPDRFFNYLRAQGIRLSSRAYPDHYAFQREDLAFAEHATVLMTEKDAVKCTRFAANNWWYVPIEVELPEEFGLKLLTLLEPQNGH